MRVTEFESLYGCSPSPVIVCSLADWNIIYANHATYLAMGITPGGMNALQQALKPCATDLSPEAGDLDRPRVVTFQALCKDGVVDILQARAQKIQMDDSEDLLLMFLQSQTTLINDSSPDVPATVLGKLAFPIYVTDQDTHEILFINQAMRDDLLTCENTAPGGDICGNTQQEGLEERCLWCPVPKMAEESYGRGDEPYQWEFQNLLTKKWFLFTDRIIDWVDGRRARMETAVDITEMKKKEELLRHYASIDMMTGAFNREWGYTMLKNALQKSRDERVVSCLCFLDLDGLKNVNDTYGHDEGDNLITSFMSAIKSSSRGADILCRWGGDEFILCLYNCEKQHAVKIMAKIADEFDESRARNTRPYEHSFSYGIVAVKPRSRRTDLDKLISKADGLMYQQKNAKRSGKLSLAG